MYNPISTPRYSEYSAHPFKKIDDIFIVSYGEFGCQQIHHWINLKFESKKIHTKKAEEFEHFMISLNNAFLLKEIRVV